MPTLRVAVIGIGAVPQRPPVGATERFAAKRFERAFEIVVSVGIRVRWQWRDVVKQDAA